MNEAPHSRAVGYNDLYKPKQGVQAPGFGGCILFYYGEISKDQTIELLKHEIEGKQRDHDH